MVDTPYFNQPKIDKADFRKFTSVPKGTVVHNGQITGLCQGDTNRYP